MSGLLGLDRKAMEAERLARQSKKRSAEVNHEPEERPSKATKRDDPNIRFPHGALRRTWALGHERENDIKIEEVLQKADLTTAVISSWQWDFDWLVDKVGLSTTKFIFVMEAKSEACKEQQRAEFHGVKSVRLCFPPMSGNLYARMHSKLMLLFHPSHLRVVVPSANPMRYDWGETGLMENTVFLLDLPRLPSPENGSSNATLTAFAKDLLHYIDAQDMPEDVKRGVLNFDFTATSEMAFIHSIPGTYDGPSLGKTGLLSLSNAVRLLNLTPQVESAIEVDFATSSLGTLDLDQVEIFTKCLRGRDPFPTPPAGKSLLTAKNLASLRDSATLDSFRIIFPSDETVKTSKGGKDAAGTIFLKASSFERPGWPSHLLRDYKSTRPGLLSHNKLILVRSSTIAFIYSGSANFSQAAWGRLSHPKGKTQKLTVANWECGVLLPVQRQEQDPCTRKKPVAGLSPVIVLDDSSTDSEDDAAQTSEQKTNALMEALKQCDAKSRGDGLVKDVLPFEVFGKVFNVPFKYPADAYGGARGPWLTK